MFRALVVDDDAQSAGEVCDALAAAGCEDIEIASHDHATSLLDGAACRPDLAVVNLHGAQLQHLQRLAGAVGPVPLFAICEARHLESVLVAGATECVTTPLRPDELVARIRATLRERTEAHHRVSREHRLSEAIATLTREKHVLERLICVDPLTGIANRQHVLTLLESEWKRSAREQTPLGVVMIDLDCFHFYNEHYGHLGGDRCLQRVAETMVGCLRRPTDVLGRYGGEEFLAVLPNTDAAGAKIVAERMRAAVEALGVPHAASNCRTIVTITAGFASRRGVRDLPFEHLIGAADLALLRAKHDGRNQVGGEAPIVPSVRVSPLRWERFAPVLADPWFAARIPACLNDAHAGAQAILHAIHGNDVARIASTAAAIRACVHELGLDDLEHLVADLERKASELEPIATCEAADAVIQYVTHVQVIYRRPSEPSIELVATS